MKLSYINNLSEKLYEELDDLAREDKKLLGLPRSIENRNRGIELIASVLRAAPTRQVDETAQGDESYQERVGKWMNACFPPEVIADVVERNFRFLEESLELVQSLGASKEQATRLVDYVYARSIGEPQQEAGGVMVTLAALCNASNLNINKCAEDELSRVWTKIEKIRAKHFSKPKEVVSPIPGYSCTCADIWGYPDPDCPAHKPKPQGHETAQGEYQKMNKVDFYSVLKEYEKEDPMFVPPLLKNYMLGFFDWLLKRQSRTAEQKGEGEEEKHFDGFYCYEYDEGRTDDRCLFPCGASWCGETPKHYPQSYGEWVKFHEQTTSALHQQINDLKEQVKEAKEGERIYQSKSLDLQCKVDDFRDRITALESENKRLMERERQVAVDAISWARSIIVDHNNPAPIIKHLNDCELDYLNVKFPPAQTDNK
jgi:DNA repair exonuclease SbcCD ATPase subunit